MSSINVCAKKKELRHYLQAYSVWLISEANPLKYIISRPVLSRRLEKWVLLLQEFEIIYVSQKAIRRQTLVDFLVDHPIPDEWKFSEDLPDENVFFIEMLEPEKYSLMVQHDKMEPKLE